MQTGRAGEAERETTADQRPAVENRWCERHGYVIDVDACRARAEQRSHCRRCLASWRQLSLPFPEPF